MKRRLTIFLDQWSHRPRRKPLVLRGARQVGKSWLVRDWGTERYGSVIELNLERDPSAASLFKDNDPKATLRRIEALTGKIVRGDGTCLLFLDEIQATPEIFAKLRWFAEELPKLPLIAAGSLLDFTLAEPSFSMPVGRVSYAHLEPMGFDEFLEAMDESRLAEFLNALSWSALHEPAPIPTALHEKLLELFRQYLLVGGMPAVVEAYRVSRSLTAVAPLHRELLANFRDDFAKYSNRVHHHRLAAVFASVPQQLGGKFGYRRVDPIERAEALGKAVELLCLARVCHQVRATAATGAPVGAGAQARGFKLLLLDVGLASTSLGLRLDELEGDFTQTNQGALAEQIAGQLLRLNFPPDEEPQLHYWRRDAKGSEAEVDYVIQHGSKLLPIEVKAGATGRLRSLHALMAARKWDRAVRFNADPPSLTQVETGPARYSLLSLPIYSVEQLPRLLASWRALKAG